MFDFINKMIDTYKTKLGMVGAVAAYVTALVNLFSDGIQLSDWQSFITVTSAVLLALGLGHKAIKIETALKK